MLERGKNGLVLLHLTPRATSQPHCLLFPELHTVVTFECSNHFVISWISGTTIPLGGVPTFFLCMFTHYDNCLGYVTELSLSICDLLSTSTIESHVLVDYFIYWFGFLCEHRAVQLNASSEYILPGGCTYTTSSLLFHIMCY